MVCLAGSQRNLAPIFYHYAPDAVQGPGTELRVFLGTLAGSTSPVPTCTPGLLGAEAVLKAGSRLESELDPLFGHGILPDTGGLHLDGEAVPAGHLIYLPPGRTRLMLEAGETPVRVIVPSGEPMGEQIIM